MRTARKSRDRHYPRAHTQFGSRSGRPERRHQDARRLILEGEVKKVSGEKCGADFGRGEKFLGETCMTLL